MRITLIPPFADASYGLQSRVASVDRTTGKGSLLIRAVTIHSDTIDAVTSSVLTRNCKIRTDNGLAKDLLERFLILWVKLQLLHHRDGVVSFWHVAGLGFDSVEWYESDTTGSLLLQDIDDLGCCFIIVDDIMEQTVAGRNLNSSSKSLADFYQLRQRTVDAIQIVLALNATNGCKATAGVLIHGVG